MNDPCPVCNGGHAWRAEPWMGIPIIVCPTVGPSQHKVIQVVHEAPSLAPEPVCSRCGKTDDDTMDLEWPGLIDVRVITAEGEEGYDDVTQLLCADCFPGVMDAIQGAGFKHHSHGGIRYLDDQRCPGAGHVIGGECPSPSEHDPHDGTYVVGQK